MNTTEHQFSWLKLIDRPAFCVKGGNVVSVNSAAGKYMISVGTDITNVVGAHLQEYESFTDGCLYLPINIEGILVNASVTRTSECDIFVINQDTECSELQALALAAQQLRIPLSNMMTVTDRLSGELSTNNRTALQAGQLRKNLFQIMRIISNMSDAGTYASLSASDMETVNLVAVVDEVMEKIQAVSESTGITIEYSSIRDSVFGLANTERLERAIYNLLSNALKFSTKGTTITVVLAHNGDKLSLTVCNTHSQTDDTHIYWKRYLRMPAIEDSRYGLGLGMTLISSVAASHGGTVLIDHPSDTQTRVTMTITITKSTGTTVRSNVLRIGGYAGGRDKGLLEFAEILASDAYKKIN